MDNIIDLTKERQKRCEHGFVFVDRDEGYVLQDPSDPLGEFAEFIVTATARAFTIS